jgi:hypothetical protein
VLLGAVLDIDSGVGGIGPLLPLGLSAKNGPKSQLPNGFENLVGGKKTFF